jgi:hypothetical protein
MELRDSLNIDIEINRDYNFTCSICMEEIDIENKCITNCNHEFCKKCLHDWFETNKITCPICREDIKEYNNNNEKNHIIKVKNENTNPHVLSVENARLLRNLQAKIYKLNMFIFFNVGYMLYNLYLEGDKEMEILNYERLYKNCTSNLNNIQTSLEDQTDLLVYTNNGIVKCDFPTKYLTNCLSN